MIDHTEQEREDRLVKWKWSMTCGTIIICLALLTLAAAISSEVCK